MQSKQLFIPDRINVGFQDRSGTYTGKLAYIIYFDQKGILRKETSWKNWRDKKIEPIEYVNAPTDGFVLNKNVGGTHGHSWEQRQAYVRVYDPRGFEFEITIPNLLFILSECDCSRGKGLEGQFVYAWHGSDLVLLPVTAQDYQVSREHTNLMSQKVKARELIPGASYTMKDLKTMTYVGKFDRYMPTSTSTSYSRDKERGITKPYVFWNGQEFVFHYNMSKLGKLECDSVASNYAELVESYYKSQYGSKIVSLFLVDGIDIKYSWFTEDNGIYYYYSKEHTIWRDETSAILRIRRSYAFTLRDGMLWCEWASGEAYSPEYMKQHNMTHYYNSIPWKEPTSLSLHALLESGTECIVHAYGLEPIGGKDNGAD